VQIFFSEFSGIIVNGNLTVAGTQDKPVIFTSINDSLNPERKDQPPKEFDWNGILVSKESGTISLKNFRLRFSTYGIKSQNPSRAPSKPFPLVARRRQLVEVGRRRERKV
jgi:hypothetical protein